MTGDDLLILVKAGFSKEEILALNGTAPKVEATEITDNKTEAVQPTEEAPKEDNIKEVVTDKTESTPQTTNVNFAPLLTDAQLEKLSQMINRGSATIDVPPQKNMDDVLGEHFKNLMIGKE